MNDLKVFKNTEFGELGILMIDGKEYFPATQCAKVLGYKDAINAIKLHCKGVVKHHLPTNGGTQTVNYIPEGDLYRLIVRSKLPSAEKFERWVFDEVLPTIRKQGAYAPNLEEIISKTATAVVTEIMKQFMPLLNNNKPEPQIINNYTEFPRKKRKSTSIISKLNIALRLEVEEMILSGLYSYDDIVTFLRKNGVILSLTSVWRYSMRLLEQE